MARLITIYHCSTQAKLCQQIALNYQQRFPLCFSHMFIEDLRVSTHCSHSRFQAGRAAPSQILLVTLPDWRRDCKNISF